MVQPCNPKGIVPSSPGLRAASYPGKRQPQRSTPTGLWPWSEHAGDATPLWLMPNSAANPG
jgi:hypothetical protein